MDYRTQLKARDTALKVSEYHKKHIQVVNIIRDQMRRPLEAVRHIANDPKASSISIMTANQILTAVEDESAQARTQAFHGLCNRVWGKPTESSVNIGLTAKDLEDSPFAKAILQAQTARIIDESPKIESAISPSNGSLITNGRSENEMSVDTQGSTMSDSSKQIEHDTSVDGKSDTQATQHDQVRESNKNLV